MTSCSNSKSRGFSAFSFLMTFLNVSKSIAFILSNLYLSQKSIADFSAASNQRLYPFRLSRPSRAESYFFAQGAKRSPLLTLDRLDLCRRHFADKNGGQDFFNPAPLLSSALFYGKTVCHRLVCAYVSLVPGGESRVLKWPRTSRRTSGRNRGNTRPAGRRIWSGDGQGGLEIRCFKTAVWCSFSFGARQ